jgi:hypothetical protein
VPFSLQLESGKENFLPHNKGVTSYASKNHQKKENAQPALGYYGISMGSDKLRVTTCSYNRLNHKVKIQSCGMLVQTVHLGVKPV